MEEILILFSRKIQEFVKNIIKKVFLALNWLKDFIKTKLRERSVKYAFVDTEVVVSEGLDKIIKGSKEYTEEEFENISKLPSFMGGYVNEETGEIFDCQGIQADEVDNDIKQFMKKEEGIVVFEG